MCAESNETNEIQKLAKEGQVQSKRREVLA